MIKAFVYHKIGNDFNSWKKVFDTKVEQMKKSGCINYSTGTFQNDPKTVYVLCDWDNTENMMNFMQTPEMVAQIKNSGAIEEPHINILTELAKQDLSYTHAH